MDDTSLPPPPPPPGSQEQINALSEKLEKWGSDNYWGDDKLMKRLDAVEKLSNETSAFLDRIATVSKLAHIIEIAFIAFVFFNIVYFWCVPV